MQNFYQHQAEIGKKLTLSWQRPLSYRNQSIDLESKSMDWFLYDNGLRHERVKQKLKKHCSWTVVIWKLFARFIHALITLLVATESGY